MKHTSYIVNLSRRTDRRELITGQLVGKNEFLWTIIPAIEHVKGAYGLWLTIQSVVRKEAERGSRYFILFEDDHCFTEAYTPKLLQQCIDQAQALGADLLSGGYSWFGEVLQISEHLFWSSRFTGMQMTVIFSKFYPAILNAGFGKEVITDLNLSCIMDSKLVIYPYISSQKEFGYSDVTSKNNESGYVEDLFVSSMQQLDILNRVRNFYFPKTT